MSATTQLLLGDDDHAALEAALAFLDSCSDDSSEFDALAELSAATSEQPSSPFEDLFMQQQQQQPKLFSTAASSSDVTGIDALRNDVDASATTQRARPTRRRAATHRSSSMAAAPKPPRKRAIAEILQLREQTLQLTARLGVLQKRRLLADSATAASLQAVSVRGSALGVDIEDAVSELHKLEEAEALNVKLKVAGRKQLKLIESLRGVFQKQNSLAAVRLRIALPCASDETLVWTHSLVPCDAVAVAAVGSQVSRYSAAL